MFVYLRPQEGLLIAVLYHLSKGGTLSKGERVIVPQERVHVQTVLQRSRSLQKVAITGLPDEVEKSFRFCILFGA